MANALKIIVPAKSEGNVDLLSGITQFDTKKIAVYNGCQEVVNISLGNFVNAVPIPYPGALIPETKNGGDGLFVSSYAGGYVVVREI